MKNKALTMLLKLGLTGGLMYLVIHFVGWEQIKTALSNMDRGRWAVGLGLMFTANCLSMLRWHLLMRSVGLNSTPWLALRLGFVGVFFNNIMPGLTGGDLVKAIYVARENPKQRAGAAVSVIVDRAIGIVALALIAAVVIPLDFERYHVAALGTYGFLAAAAVGSAFALSRRLKAGLRRLLGRDADGSDAGGANPSAEGGLSGLGTKIFAVFSKIESAVSTYRERMGVIAVALGMSVVVHMIIIFALSAFGGALALGGLEAIEADGLPLGDAQIAEWVDEHGRDPTHDERFQLEVQHSLERVAELETLREVELSAYCSVVPIIMIGSAVPLFPMGAGVGEALFPFFFDMVHVASSDAVALSLTYRITAMLISLLGGLVLLMDRRRVMEAQHEAEEDTAEA